MQCWHLSMYAFLLPLLFGLYFQRWLEVPTHRFQTGVSWIPTNICKTLKCPSFNHSLPSFATNKMIIVTCFQCSCSVPLLIISLNMCLWVIGHDADSSFWQNLSQYDGIMVNIMVSCHVKGKMSVFLRDPGGLLLCKVAGNKNVGFMGRLWCWKVRLALKITVLHSTWVWKYGHS